MTVTLPQQLTLTDDELRVLARGLGVHDFPAVLAVGSRHRTIDQRELAYQRASGRLLSRELIVEGRAHPDLIPMLQALHRPDCELAMRVVTPNGTARVSAMRQGSLGVLACRMGENIRLRILDEPVDPQDMASALVAELPPSRPADVQPIGAPLHELSHCLSDTHDFRSLADRIRSLGVESHAAMLLGAALASRQAFAEIVHYTLADDQGRISRGPAAVAVFYTKRGRIVGAPSASPSGQLWTTLKAASEHVLTRAIIRLIELSNSRWGSC